MISVEYMLAASVVIAGLLGYRIGLYRGGRRGYLAAVYDYLILLTEDEASSVEAKYLETFGDQIDAGREGRN